MTVILFGVNLLCVILPNVVLLIEGETTINLPSVFRLSVILRTVAAPIVSSSAK
jgi:hypothetical protein